VLVNTHVLQNLKQSNALLASPTLKGGLNLLEGQCLRGHEAACLFEDELLHICKIREVRVELAFGRYPACTRSSMY
jgi:hypothetical protein